MVSSESTLSTGHLYQTFDTAPWLFLLLFFTLLGSFWMSTFRKSIILRDQFIGKSLSKPLNYIDIRSECKPPGLETNHFKVLGNGLRKMGPQKGKKRFGSENSSKKPFKQKKKSPPKKKKTSSSHIKSHWLDLFLKAT